MAQFTEVSAPPALQGSLIAPIQGSHTQTTKFTDPVILGPRTGTQHNAVDWQTNVGTPIYATHSGKITRADAKDVWGGNIIQLTGNVNGATVDSIYAHLDQMYVKAGDTVQAGQIIGTTGNTGKATTGPHLYFQTNVNGKPVDPNSMINPLNDQYTGPNASQFASIMNTLKGIPGSQLLNPNMGQIALPSSYTGCPKGFTAEAYPTIGNPTGTHVCFLTDLATLPGGAAAENIVGGAGNALGLLSGLPGQIVQPAFWGKSLALIAGGIMVLIGLWWVMKATVSTPAMESVE